MILAHHAGEDVVLMLAASGAGAGRLMFMAWRSRLGNLVDRMRGR